MSVVARETGQVEKASEQLKGLDGEAIGDVSAIASKNPKKELFFGGFRFNDYAPWYGGDRIGRHPRLQHGVRGQPTALPRADRCALRRRRHHVLQRPAQRQTFNVMGNSVYSNAATDVAAIGVSCLELHQRRIGAEPDAALRRHWSSPIVGQYLCQSGSYTGEVCGLRVVDTGAAHLPELAPVVVRAGRSVADVINSAGSGSYAAGHGDSGGPVYLRTGRRHRRGSRPRPVLTPNARSGYPAYYPDTCGARRRGLEPALRLRLLVRTDAGRPASGSIDAVGGGGSLTAAPLIWYNQFA